MPQRPRPIRALTLALAACGVVNAPADPPCPAPDPLDPMAPGDRTTARVVLHACALPIAPAATEGLAKGQPSAHPLWTFTAPDGVRLVAANQVAPGGALHPVYRLDVDGEGRARATLDAARPTLDRWLASGLPALGALFAGGAADLDGDGHDDLVLTHATDAPLAHAVAWRWDPTTRSFAPFDVARVGDDPSPAFGQSPSCTLLDAPAGAEGWGDGALDLTCARYPDVLDPTHSGWRLLEAGRDDSGSTAFRLDVPRDDGPDALLPSRSALRPWFVAFVSDGPALAPPRFALVGATSATAPHDGDGWYAWEAAAARFAPRWHADIVADERLVSGSPACAARPWLTCGDPNAIAWDPELLDGRAGMVWGTLANHPTLVGLVATGDAAHPFRELTGPLDGALWRGRGARAFQAHAAVLRDLDLDGCQDVLVSAAQEDPADAERPAPTWLRGRCEPEGDGAVVRGYDARGALRDASGAPVLADGRSIEVVAIDGAALALLRGTLRRPGTVLQLVPPAGARWVGVDLRGDPARGVNAEGIGSVVECWSGTTRLDRQAIGDHVGPGMLTAHQALCPSPAAAPLTHVVVRWASREAVAPQRVEVTPGTRTTVVVVRQGGADR